jgi:hypothetical protein
MCEIDYESNNKAILESCCKIINKAAATYEYKKNKSETRLRIEDHTERKRLKHDLELM